jgi:H+/Cl- antiporter ClcA
MTVRWDFREHLQLLLFVLRWLALGIPIGAIVGSAVALFLWSLDQVTLIHWQTPWLLFLLPLAGAVSGWMYQCLGQCSEGGNNLVIEQIHTPGGGIPARMAPLVLIGTLITHLFGGSAGREGTAVQMGGSLAGTFARRLRLGTEDTRLMLMSGVAAGFGAVFGTPLTGAIFALEVLAIGRMSYRGLIPCLIASIAGDQVNTAWGIGHTHYSIALPITSTPGITLDWSLAAKVAIAAVFFGFASVLFIHLSHGLNWLFKRTIPLPWMRPVVGGCLLILLVWLVGNRDYLGLGVNTNPYDTTAVTIQSCFQAGGAGWLSWWWKTLFTALTVSSGFKGGEVTPLFFIGAALGNVLAVVLGAPVDLLAGLGFVAVFAGATNTPLACTIMALELFGPGNSDLLSSGFVVYAAIACFFSYFISGHSSIYHSQQRDIPNLATHPSEAA